MRFDENPPGPGPRAGFPFRGPRPGEVLLLGAAALGARLLCVLETAAPDRDAAWYAWAARSFHEGRPAGALASVFPPLHPFLASFPAGLFAKDGADWWHGLQAVGTLWELAGILLLFDLLARRAGKTLAWIACAFWALGMLPAWTVADGMSGPLFRLLLVLALRGWILGPWWLPGLAAGLASVTRPEGLALLPLALAAPWRSPGDRRPPKGLFALFLALGPRAFYLLLRARAAGEFLLFPKGHFMTPLSAFAEPDLPAAAAHWFHQAGRFLSQGFDGLGYLAWPMLPLGAWLTWKNYARRESRGRLPEGWGLPLLLAGGALAVVPLYFGNRRFWTPWLPVLLPAAALPLALPARKRPFLTALLVGASLLPHTVRLALPRRRSLAPLAALGPRIAGDLRKAPLPPPGRGQSPPPWARSGLVSDLPRLYLFAGLRPPPPCSIPASLLLEAARSPRVRFAASLKKRRKLPPALMKELGFQPARFDPALEGALSREGFEVWRR